MAPGLLFAMLVVFGFALFIINGVALFDPFGLGHGNFVPLALLALNFPNLNDARNGSRGANLLAIMVVITLLVIVDFALGHIIFSAGTPALSFAKDAWKKESSHSIRNLDHCYEMMILLTLSEISYAANYSCFRRMFYWLIFV